MNGPTERAGASLPYQDPSLAVSARVEDLLSRMTVEDKAGLLFHTHLAPGADLDAPQPMTNGPSARSMMTRYRINHFNLIGSAPDGRQFAAWHNQLQGLAADQPLGIPITLSSDPRNHFSDNPLASMMAGPFSQWPEPLGLGAIGSEELVRRFADIARQEYVAVGIRVALHPQLDLATEPRWGRVSSTFGEDRDLTSRLGVAYIGGFQGTQLGPSSVATMAKHFPGGGPQKDGTDPHFSWGREQVYDEEGSFDGHLTPFVEAVAAGTSQLMPGYGVPVGTGFEEVGFAFNHAIITGILREQLGFDGIVCTDWGLVSDLDVPAMPGVGTAKAWGLEDLDRDERLLRLFEAGVDQLGGEHCADLVVDLVRSGRLAENRVDDSARRLLREKFVLGLFDHPFVDEERAALVVGCEDFRDAGRQAQKSALVLLTNAGHGTATPLLPLRPGSRVYLDGATKASLSGHGSVVDDPSDADVAVIRLKTPTTRLASFDTGSLDYPPEELDRVLAICAQVPTVIDVNLGRPPVLTPIVAAAAAIVVNFGIEENLLFDVLFGDGAPEGGLPFDLPRSMEAVLASESSVPFGTADPLFRFGHGLRYSSPGASTKPL